MLPSEQKLVQEVIDRLTLLERACPDSLERFEVMLELEDEFGTEAVRWAFRFFEALKAAEDRRMAVAGTGPLWDRELDGRAKSTGLLE